VNIFLPLQKICRNSISFQVVTENLFTLYKGIVNYWIMVDNSNSPYELIAEGKGETIQITNSLTYQILKGISLSFQRLVEQKKKNDEELVFFRDGEIVKIKARDL
jgi:hypothetical protein